MSWEVRTMQSKTSYFNATLFRKNLTRFWPLWGLASFIGALFPLAVLLDMVHRGWNVLSAPDFTGMYYDAVSAVPVINLVYAALCAMAVWSYLYNARSVGLMHTLPIRREGLFLTNFLSGLSMTLIPYAVTGVLCVVVSLCGGAFDAKGLAVTVLAVLGESFFYFSSATFVAFITGNAFAMPPLYALLHFLAVLLDWLISSFAQGFIFGFSTYYTGVVEWLSPTVYLVNNVRCARQYVEVQQTFPDGTPYTSRLLTSADLESFWLIGVYALVGLALAALALILYRRRRSETAGDVVAVGWLRPVFRYGVAGLCALLGGQFLYSLFWYGFQQGEYYDTLPMVVCLLAAGAIGYYGASMLLAKAFKVFRGSWKGLGIVLAGCALVCCVLHFDLLGVADRVPEASQIQTLEIRIADNTYTLTPEKDADLLEQVRALHQTVVPAAASNATSRLTATPSHRLIWRYQGRRGARETVQTELNSSCAWSTVRTPSGSGSAVSRITCFCPSSGLMRQIWQAKPWAFTRSTELPDRAAGKSSVTETMPQKYRWPCSSVRKTGSRPAMPRPPWISWKGPAIYSASFSMAA